MKTFSDKLKFEKVHKSSDNWRCVKFIDSRNEKGYSEYQVFFGIKNIEFIDSLKVGDEFVCERNEYQKRKDGEYRTVVIYKLGKPRYKS